MLSQIIELLSKPYQFFQKIALTVHHIIFVTIYNYHKTFISEGTNLNLISVNSLFRKLNVGIYHFPFIE